MTDWGQLYGDHVDALAGVVGGLGPEQATLTVPASPDWSVRDVLAHLAGVAADNLAGRTDGAPGRRWTGRQVSERADADVHELLAEIRANQVVVGAWLDTAEWPGLVWDVAVHTADLHEALGLGAPPEVLWRPVLDAAVAARGAELVGQVPAYELFRGLFSRRSTAQMRAWGTGLDDDALAAVCIFGPREDDQPVPTA